LLAALYTAIFMLACCRDPFFKYVVREPWSRRDVARKHAGDQRSREMTSDSPLLATLLDRPVHHGHRFINRKGAMLMTRA
jgi:hypothetical protein